MSLKPKLRNKGKCVRFTCLVLSAVLAGCATAPSGSQDVEAGTFVDLASYNREIRRMGIAGYCGAGECDSLPSLLVASAPAYPSAELGAGVNGHATIVFDVTEDGLLTNFKVESASADAFAQAAIDALKHWRFDPPKLKGKPVKSRNRQSFPFVAR